MDRSSVYFDNAAGTFPKPEALYRALSEEYRLYGVNINRGSYSLGRMMSEKVEECRERLAAIFKIDSGKLHFSPSTTFSLNQILGGLELKRGSTVYHSPFEHNSVMRPLERLRKANDLSIEQLAFRDGRVEDEQFDNFFDCDLLILSHQSNVTGLLLPINEICRKVKELNSETITIIDGAQCGGYHDIDWKYVDFYCFSAHKTLYGPSGITGFINNSGQEIEPLLYGGTGNSSEALGMPESDHARYEAGSQNSLGIIGLNAALKWLATEGITNIHQKALELTEHFHMGLSKLDNYTIYREEGLPYGSTLSFNNQTVAPQELELYLSKEGYALRSGFHCSPITHEFLATGERGGTVRFSPGWFSSAAEVEGLLGVLGSIK